MRRCVQPSQQKPNQADLPLVTTSCRSGEPDPFLVRIIKIPQKQVQKGELIRPGTAHRSAPKHAQRFASLPQRRNQRFPTEFYAVFVSSLTARRPAKEYVADLSAALSARKAVVVLQCLPRSLLSRHQPGRR